MAFIFIVIGLSLLYLSIKPKEPGERKFRYKKRLKLDDKYLHILSNATWLKIKNGECFIRFKGEKPLKLYDDVIGLIVIQWLCLSCNKKNVPSRVKVEYNNGIHEFEITEELENRARFELKRFIKIRENPKSGKRNHENFKKCQNCFFLSKCDYAVKGG